MNGFTASRLLYKKVDSISFEFKYKGNNGFIGTIFTLFPLFPLYPLTNKFVPLLTSSNAFPTVARMWRRFLD